LLELTINTIHYGSHVANLNSQPFEVKGETHDKSNATKIGGGAILGAIIGGIAGGGKGAAVGATVGAGAGTAGAAATGKREAVIQSEAVLNFVTANDTRLTMPSAYEVQHPSTRTTTASTNSRYPGNTSTSNGTSTSNNTSTSGTSTSSSSAGSASTNGNYPDSRYPTSSSSDSNNGRTNSTIQTANDTPSNDEDAEPTLRRRPPASTDANDSQNTNTQGSDTQNTGQSFPPDPRVNDSNNGRNSRNDPNSFSARDRRTINTCLAENSSQLPAGTTSHNTSLDNSALVSGGTLPRELMRKVRSLPMACEQQLGTLPGNYERVVYNGQVLLLNDDGYRIVDMFSLDNY
jgi:outer membrane lipoprotein SlyB